MRPGILTLTTDFGTDGPYVAALKGVVLGLAPRSQIVDVSHAIRPQDVLEGAFVLEQVVDAFPEGTVHLAVVDPGVGTDRRLVVVEARGQFFVLPDNGLIGGILDEGKPWRAWEIRNPKLRRPVVSSTFHGRDILAPVASFLLRGGDPTEVGPIVEDLILLRIPVPTESDGVLAGEVVFVDRFGNLITNLTRGRLEHGRWTVEVLDESIDDLARTYGDRPGGSLVALIGSSDRLEIAEVDGDASRRLGALRGTAVLVRRIGRLRE